ncbi:MAG: D-alanyl-D-alanine carboxypeptidase family protein [Acutalibacteraceae bacterium]|nr:D-alanyl-D-alanine carboxypeptidase family protein [Acutalibacteraceae bacterium]
MKRLISFLLCIVMIVPLFVTSSAEGEMPVEVKAKAAVLMDQTTGKVLMKMNEHEKLYPASVTKIMSMLLVMEAIDSNKIRLTDIVTTSPVAASKGGSQIWLKEGETMSVDELLRATAVYSANDACTALGEYVAGSDEAFVVMMNERAAQLGMKNTHFENCTGLDDETENHLTTAYDIALMSRELMKHELIKEYTTIWMDSLRDGKTELVNTNKLIRFYNGATGLKTGTTNKAGCCVSATATRDGTSLVAVVMGSENSSDRFEGAKAMLNWGFANYSSITPQIDKKLITDVNIVMGEERKITPQIPPAMSVLIPKGRENDIVQNVELVAEVEAPVESNQTLGTVTVSLDGEVLGKYNLTSPHYVDRLSFKTVFCRLLAVICNK